MLIAPAMPARMAGTTLLVKVKPLFVKSVILTVVRALSLVNALLAMMIMLMTPAMPAKRVITTLLVKMRPLFALSAMKSVVNVQAVQRSAQHARTRSYKLLNAVLA